MASHWVPLRLMEAAEIVWQLRVLPAFPEDLSSVFSTHVRLLTTASSDPPNPHSRHTQSHIIKNKNLEKYWQVLSLMEFGLFTVKWSDLTLIPLGLRLSNPHSHWLLPAWDSGMCQEACTAKPGSFVACYFTMLKIKVFKWFPTWNLVEVNSE